MNKVQLVGKIVRIKNLSTVTYITIYCRDGKNKNYIDVTIFDTKFFNRYWVTGMWIGISGRLNKNAKRDYKLEVIAENIFFTSDVPMIGDSPINGAQEKSEDDFIDMEIDANQQITDLMRDWRLDEPFGLPPEYTQPYSNPTK